MADPVSAHPNRRLLWLGSAAAAVVVALVIWLLVADDEPGSTGSEPTPTPSATSTPTSSEPPSTTATPTQPTPSPTPTRRPKPIRADFEGDVNLGNGVTVEITDIEAVQGEAHGPGEVAAPSLRFTVQVTNVTRKELNLDLALLTVYYGPDSLPAGELSGPGVVRLPETLAPGRSARGKYVFRVPTRERDQVRVDFTYTLEAPKVIFTGPAAG